MTAPTLRLQAGGTLNPRQHVYIERAEDAHVLRLLMTGEFVNIFSTRQMGKSSLVTRARLKLIEAGTRAAVVDLAADVGDAADADAFYHSLLDSIADWLDLTIDVDAWWRARPPGSISQRLNDFLRDEVLGRIDGPIVIFLDEIDSTLRLPYTDDLFATIRGIYNRRANDAAYERLTFCLLGVATPNELIKDRRTTPYNIGTTIELRDFDPRHHDLTPLTAHLPPEARGLLTRVLHWTGGQPHLTVSLCSALTATTTEADIDRMVAERFNTLGALSGDPHFRTILSFLDTRAADGQAVFRLYASILRGREEADATDMAHVALKLCGLVRRDDHGRLVIRNLIYRRLFDRDWVRGHLPRVSARAYRAAAIAAVVVLGVGLSGGAYYVQNLKKIERDLRETELAQDTLLALGVKVGQSETGPGLEAIFPNNVDQAAFIRGIEAVARLGDVQELSVSSEDVTDLSPLRQFPRLRALRISVPLERLLARRRATHAPSAPPRPTLDLTPLASLTALQTLTLTDTQISDVRPLASLTALQTLSLASTLVSDVRPLASLTALQRLDLRDTRVPPEWQGEWRDPFGPNRSRIRDSRPSAPAR